MIDTQIVEDLMIFQIQIGLYLINIISFTLFMCLVHYWIFIATWYSFLSVGILSVDLCLKRRHIERQTVSKIFQIWIPLR